MGTTKAKLDHAFDELIQQFEDNHKRNEMQRQKEHEQEIKDAQSFASELDADPKMKALFMETDSEIGLSKLIHQRTGVRLY